MNCRPFGAHAMRFIAHRVYTAGVNPAIIEIEERTNRDRVVDRFVCEARFV